ncbi:RloB domain-containing protein [Actinomadura darangshiensis]|uniref:RloB domain-containing protein n=1 Tax=Actinomadura darangshiensis TaxID=705336 RepID=A0A4R5AC51_9ACTN|nr:RloB family protein [Actinomadura darangshiensis]TDD69801.1 RloB domain-containing protein [Actinomadura darangshiensis]
MSPKSRRPGGRSNRAFNTQTDLRRRPGGTREERRSLLILCEGKTEKQYFSGMRTRRGPQLAIDAPGCDHVALAREATRRCGEAEYDEVWCVLDTELDDRLVNEVLKEAQGCDLGIAFSSPSFELWLILHCRDHTRPFQSAKEAEKALKVLRPGWSKALTRFEDFEIGVVDACGRARRLHDGDGLPPNPSSSVWRLVEKIRGPSAE